MRKETPPPLWQCQSQTWKKEEGDDNQAPTLRTSACRQKAWRGRRVRRFKRMKNKKIKSRTMTGISVRVRKEELELWT